MTGETEAVDAIVAMASWEPRFLLGMERTLETVGTQRLLVYFVAEYRDRTVVARRRLAGVVERYPDIAYEEREVSFGAPAEMWRVLEEDLGPRAKPGDDVLIDLTTMPREVIWSVLFWLEASGSTAHYVYNRPENYTKEWLARDPNEPRLVYKLAGTLEIQRPTALVAVTGFDESRCRQAVEFYEPARVVLAAQCGTQFENDVRNVGSECGKGDSRVERVEVDAFGDDHGYGVLKRHLGELVGGHNVILCSFGPKPSAIALYRLQRGFAEVALAYIGCKEYNREYSVGLGDAVVGTISFGN